jgi:sulfide dehydrogenase [flavocytochrome c] flavoprotein subunit
MIKKKRLFLNSIFQWTLVLLLNQIGLSKKINAKSKPKVVVLGAGFGGASCVNYLSNFTDLIDLIVVDKNRWIKTCPFSNLVIGDLLDESYVTFKPRFNKSVKFVVNELKFIDADKKEILFVDELSLDYDFLIMAPGIGYQKKQIEGYSINDNENIPHCWDGENKISYFKKSLDSLENNCKVIISCPDYPYRCPPAPYERASMIASFLKNKRNKFKILIFDSKNSFTKKNIFLKEWKKIYGDSVEWISRKKGGLINRLEKNRVINSDGEKIDGDFIHIIPEQSAGKIIFDSKLCNGEWCKINPQTFQLLNFKDIYVVGDSIDAGDMPKSAFSAESQAKILSLNLVNRILEKAYLDPVFLNTCYSFSSYDRAFSITSWYRLNSANDRIVSLGSSQSSEDGLLDERLRESKEAYGWYESITKTLYG